MVEIVIIVVAVIIVLGLIIAFMSWISLAMSALFRLAGWDTKDDTQARSIEENEKLLAEMEEVLKESRERQEQQAVKPRRLPK